MMKEVLLRKQAHTHRDRQMYTNTLRGRSIFLNGYLGRESLPELEVVRQHDVLGIYLCVWVNERKKKREKKQRDIQWRWWYYGRDEGSLFKGTSLLWFFKAIISSSRVILIFPTVLVTACATILILLLLSFCVFVSLKWQELHKD